MTLEWLLGWWNLIFLIPLGLALAYLFAYTLSGWTFGDAHVDVDAEADIDVHADIDTQVDVGHELEHGSGHHDVDVDSDVGHSTGIMTAFVGLGVGRVPLSIVLMVLCLTYGTAGFASNQLLRNSLAESGVWLSLPIAVLLSLGLTMVVSRLVAQYMPLNETSARLRSDLVGRRGVAIFGIDKVSGMVAVTDEGGDRYQVAARIYKENNAIPAGTEVVLTRYDTAGGYFFVKASDMGGG